MPPIKQPFHKRETIYRHTDHVDHEADGDWNSGIESVSQVDDHHRCCPWQLRTYKHFMSVPAWVRLNAKIICYL